MKQYEAWLAASLVVVLGGCSEDAATPSSTPEQAGASTGGAPGSSGAGGSVPSTTAGASSGGASAGSGGTEPGAAGTTTGGQASGGSGGQSSGGSSGQPSDGGAAGAPPTVDVFGIPILRPSKVPGYEWNSLHWATGDVRTVTGRDPSDPTGWSIRRGDTSSMEIDGAGVLSMGGAQPRFYVQPQTGESEP